MSTDAETVASVGVTIWTRPWLETAGGPGGAERHVLAQLVRCQRAHAVIGHDPVVIDRVDGQGPGRLRRRSRPEPACGGCSPGRIRSWCRIESRPSPVPSSVPFSVAPVAPDVRGGLGPPGRRRLRWRADVARNICMAWLEHGSTREDAVLVAVSPLSFERRLGAFPLGDGRAEFRVWAPAAGRDRPARGRERALARRRRPRRPRGDRGDAAGRRLHVRRRRRRAARSLQPLAARGPARAVAAARHRRFRVDRRAAGRRPAIDDLVLYEHACRHVRRRGHVRGGPSRTCGTCASSE